MVRKGEIIVGIDPELRDLYCCEVVLDGEERDPLRCRVLYMIAYPIQYKPDNPGISEEHAPLPQGATVSLKYVRRVETGDRNYRDYEASLDRCLRDYEQRRRFIANSHRECRPQGWQAKTPDSKEFEILERHAQRQFSSYNRKAMKA